MFEVGETVYVDATQLKGTVLEVDAGIAYIELTNGVEMEYKVSDLISEAEVVKRLEQERESKAFIPTPGLFSQPATQKDRRSAARALKMIEEIYPMLLGVLPKDLTDPVERINKLSEKTGTPVIVYLGGAEDSNFMTQVLRKTMINTLSNEGNTLIVDMLLAKCQNVIDKYEGNK